MVAEAKGVAEPGARVAADDDRFDFRQLAFRVLWILVEQPLADDHPQDGVAEELHPLVGRQAVLHARGVREGGFEQPRVVEEIADLGLAGVEIGAAQFAGVGRGIGAHRNGRLRKLRGRSGRDDRPLRRQSSCRVGEVTRPTSPAEGACGQRIPRLDVGRSCV